MNGTDTLVINTTNEAPSTLKHRELPELILKVYLTRGIIAIPMALITSFSNGLVMFLFLTDPKRCLRSSPTCLLVASLALVDFMVGGFLEPTDAYYNLAIAFGRQHSIRRKDLQSAAAYFLLCSMLLLLLITFDRYTAISRPIHYPHRITKRRVCISVVMVWIYCALLIIGIRQWGEKFRNEIFCVHVDVVVLVITVLFCNIVYLLRKQTSSLKRFSRSSDDIFVVRASERERKITMTLLLMLVIFLVCTMPWFIMMQIFDYCDICKKNWWIMKLLFILFQANCAFNPFLCTLRMPPYKTSVKLALLRFEFFRRCFRSTCPARQEYQLQRRDANCRNRGGRKGRLASSSSFVLTKAF